MSELARAHSVKPDFKVLDALRGIAATYVVVNHSRGHLMLGGSAYAALVPVAQWSFATKAYFALLQLTALGSEFVIFFFVLSGFSINHSLTKRPAIVHFYQRRLTRLYPPDLLALCWAALVFHLLVRFAPAMAEGQSVFGTWRSTVSNLLYVRSGALIPQFWSLTHEVLFYLCIPVLFRLSKRAYIAVSLLLYAVGWLLFPRIGAEAGILGNFVFNYNIFFVVGILLYDNFDLLQKRLRMRLGLFLTVAACLVGLMVVVKRFLGEGNKATPVIASLLATLCIVNFLHHNINNRVLTVLGTLSYTVYVTHFASIIAYKLLLTRLGMTVPQIMASPFLWIVAVPFCLLIAVPFYLVAEKPSKLMLDRMRRREPDTASS